MQAFLPVIIGIGLFVCAFGYMTFRNNAAKRAREKRRNQFNDRV